MSTHIGLRQIAALIVSLVSALAQALPAASNVPGGIALIRIGAIGKDNGAPRVWFGERPVLVAAENGNWVAVVGLALDHPAMAVEPGQGFAVARAQVEYPGRIIVDEGGDGGGQACQAIAGD